VNGNAPSVTVSDGTVMWIYYPKFKSAERYSLGRHSPLDAAIAALIAALNLSDVEKSYHISADKTEKGYQLQLLPRNPSLKRLFKTFAIQINNNLEVERTEMIQPNGDQIVTTYSKESRASIDPATFKFTPPPGTDVSVPLGR
jgi:outer membrane lipoprotein carrier protein